MTVPPAQQNIAVSQGRAWPVAAPEARLKAHEPRAAHPSEFRQADSLLAEQSVDPDRYTDFIGRVEDEQEDVRDAREDLLGSRFRLEAQRRELLKVRENAANQAGIAYGLIRKHLAELGLMIPDEIGVAFVSAEKLRDTLGEKECEYEEAEKAYNRDEWAYTQKEARFIDNVRGSAPVPAQTSTTRPTYDYSEKSTRFSFGFLDTANMVAEADGDFPNEIFVTDMELDDNSHFHPDTSTVRSDVRRRSWASGSRPSGSALGLPLSEALHSGHARLNWAGTRYFIDEWLLAALDASRLEKGRLQSSMSTQMMGHDEWWGLVSKHWSEDTTEESGFHTGDTTISEEALTLSISSNGIRNLFERSDTAALIENQFSATPLLDPDHVMDATELFDFPADIELHDLLEDSSSGLSSSTAFSDRTRARRTNPSKRIRGLTRPDASSLYIIDEGSSQTSSNSNITQSSQTYDATGFDEIYPELTSRWKPQNEMPSCGIDNVQLPQTVENRHVFGEDRRDWQEEPAACTCKTTAGPLSCASKFVRSRPCKELPSRVEEPCYPDHDLTTLGLYIRVNDFSGWYLPLLPLLDIPASSRILEPCDTDRTFLEALPFVTMPGMPLRLPGPSH